VLALLVVWLWPRSGGVEPRLIKVTGEFTGMPGTAPRIVATLDNFDQLEVGMTYEKVVELIGAEGLPIANDGARGVSGRRVFTTLIEWKNEDGSVLSGRFKSGRLVSKTQVGLK
jgi:hypothetical protein